MFKRKPQYRLQHCSSIELLNEYRSERFTHGCTLENSLFIFFVFYGVFVSTKTFYTT